MTRRYDLVVLGGGTGGLVAAQIAAGVGARVALVERDRTGGDCLWTGCVPSKSLIASATAAHRMRHADELGLPAVDPKIDFARVMERVWRVIHTIAPQDSAEHLRAAGVEVIEADGRFTGPGRIEAGGRELRWRTAIIATGSAPVIPAIEGLADADPLTTDTVWALRELPRRLLVLGGGPIGCELSQAMARLGAEVTVVELADRLLLKEEPQASELVRSRLAGEGVRVLVGAHATAIRQADHGYELVLGGGQAPVQFDRVLVVTGRRPRTTNLGLEAVGVELKEGGAVAVDARLRTSARRIYAVGDVTGLLPFTHVAAHHARIATPNALFAARQKVSSTVPWVTFTDPEVARIGLTEDQAREQWNERTQIAESDYAALDRALTSGQAYGFAKLVGDPRGRLVGATVCAPAGGEVIAELTAWISQGAQISHVSRTIHAYPTLAEGPARAADHLLTERLLGSRAKKLARPVLAMLRWAAALR
ncbi:MAG: FAD-dependent oxidoreductase [Actinomycetota bacterium]|nr:FAD-dependent oxidoreductase [Actinomycetota bacterium]